MQPKLKAPFGWIGGKSKLSDDIVKLIPQHSSYIEVFGGALSVLYRKPKSKIEIVNDINGDLVNLHRIIKSNPHSLSDYLQQLLISREIFNDIKLKNFKPRNNIERAAYYYYLLSMSFGSKGENFAMPKSRRPKDIYRDFRKWSDRLKFVTIEHMSFEKLIKEYDREEAFFYCDPPYFGTESYYKDIGGFGKDKHILLRDTLSSVRGKFLLSYNDDPFIRELYKEFNIVSTKKIEYTLGSNVHARQKRVSEVFISNYSRSLSKVIV